jgi:hypothetical protein
MRESPENLVGVAECRDKLAQLYFSLGDVEKGREEFRAVKLIRGEVGKEALRGVTTNHDGRQRLKRGALWSRIFGSRGGGGVA